MKKELDSNPIFKIKYLKSKIKSYSNRITAIFFDNKMPSGDSHCICLSLTALTDSVLKMGKNYYLQTFLEECKYKVKEKKISKFITDDVGISSSDDDDNDDDKSIEKDSKEDV